jgi:hypothetical protein
MLIQYAREGRLALGQRLDMGADTARRADHQATLAA